MNFSKLNTSDFDHIGPDQHCVFMLKQPLNHWLIVALLTEKVRLILRLLSLNIWIQDIVRQNE